MTLYVTLSHELVILNNWKPHDDSFVHLNVLCRIFVHLGFGNTVKHTVCCLIVLYHHCQNTDWNKYDDRLMKAVERGEVDKVAAVLGKKGILPTKLDVEGRSA